MVLLADERNIMLLNRTTDQTVGGTLCPAGSVAPLTDGGEDANAYDDVGTALIGGSLTLFRAADIDLVEGGSQILWIADGGGGGNHVLVCDLSSPLGDVEAVRVADAIPPSSMTVNGTLVSFPGGAFLTAGVLPGDLAYVNTAEHTVAAVPAEGTLVLTQDTGIVGSATVQIDVHGDATAVAAVAADRAFVAFRCQRSGVRGAVVRDLRVVGTGLVAEQTGGNGGVICGTGKWPWNGDHLLATTFNLGSVADLAYDAATQVLLIADEDHNRIVAVNTSASSVTFAGLAIGPGEARTVAGGGNGEGGYNGDAVPPSVALLNEPSGVAFGLDGWIYVADRGNGRVRRFQR